MKYWILTTSLSSAFLIVLCSPFTLRGESEFIRFQEQIRPILSDHCFACHGFDADSRQADLRLDVADGIFTDRGGAPIVAPGDPANSSLWERITSDDDDLVMPPLSTQKPLSSEQKELLRKWIEQGANYDEHWSFKKPRKQVVPDVEYPAWIRQPIDRFVIARLEDEGLAPSPEAGRETLIRRVAFALTGLPPTLGELTQFLDDASPLAYEHMVERYLAKPQFGEEMARHWLDVARYADTHGLHLDNERLMWAYRDWVVRAMNENLPYDKFTIWQLAGDQLANPTSDQKIATGFNRCNVTTSEGGSIPEEFLYRYAVDRTSTAVQAWMGLTAGCAVCHDHKYDPLSSREFYSLYAFFYSAADPAMDKNVHHTEPYLTLPSTDQFQQLEAARQGEAAAFRSLQTAIESSQYVDPGHNISTAEMVDATGENDAVKGEISSGKPANPTQNDYAIWVRDSLFDDFFPLGATMRNTTRNPAVWESDPAFGTPSGYRALRQANSYFHEDILQPGLQPISIPAQGTFQTYLRVDPLNVPQAVAIVVKMPGGTRRIRWGRDSHLDGGPSEKQQTVRKGPLPNPGTWTQLSFTADELALKTEQTVTSISLQVAGGVVWWDALTLSGRRQRDSDPGASFQVWWNSLRSNSPPDVPEPLREILKAGPAEKVPAERRQELLRFYLTYVARPSSREIEQARRKWELARSRRMAIEDSIPGTLVFHEMETPREAFVMLRGEYDRPGEKVEPGVPAALPPLTVTEPDQPATRLDLARWLVSPEHPLTARVAVNRLWQQVFGKGLVATSDDFGAQGSPPTHPELLDWLAVEFQESGWDVKQLVRTLVTSHTFRQSSQLHPETLNRDPHNRLYARGPRLRLDAEQIRDNALFVSGLLELEQGGPGVKTYQPPNIWEPVGYGDSNTRYYLRDHGTALYRRSLYSFLKRTAPPPFMTNFDAPNREQSCAVRERSNTPLQALQLLNDVQHFESARALAERLLLAPDLLQDDQRISQLYRIVLSRLPQPDEQLLVREALQEQRNLYARDLAAARQVIQVGETQPRTKGSPAELAAWTLITNMVLNLDETITRN